VNENSELEGGSNREFGKAGRPDFERRTLSMCRVHWQVPGRATPIVALHYLTYRKEETALIRAKRRLELLSGYGPSAIPQEHRPDKRWYMTTEVARIRTAADF
jgi:hypothetical protein